MMIMEAMRLSLIDHEDQQRRQREEEIRNQRNGANVRSSNDGSTTLTAQPPSSFPGASTIQSSLTAPSLSSQSSEDSRASHRASASLSATPVDPVWRRRSSPPPFSALSALLNTTSSINRHAPPEARPSVYRSLNQTPQQNPSFLVGTSSDVISTSAEPSVSESSLNLNDSSYDVLPSSPESAGSRLPLIESPAEPQVPHAG